MKGLTFRNNTGMRYQLYRRELFYGDQSIMGRRSGIYGSIRNTETGSFQTSNVLTYDKRFQKKHKVVVQLGQEFVKRWTRVLESGVSGLPTDEFILGDMSLGTPSVASSDETMMIICSLSLLVSTMTLPISICFPRLSVRMVLLNSERIINGGIFLLYLRHGV